MQQCIANLALIKMTVARFMGIESFLIRHSNGHIKQTYGHLKKFLHYF